MKKVIYVPRSNNPAPSLVAVGEVLSMLGELTTGKRCFVVTDENLYHHYSQLIEKYPHIIIPTGESNKNLATIEYIHRNLLEMNADRSSYIIGFGGGIVTDVTGFAASTYMRGVGFGFMATSLLAQVDASVGGKNGVNLDGYKNIIGTFNQPDFVLCDTQVLATLPPRELRAGMSEALKCGLIRDSKLFEIFENHTFEQIVSTHELLFEVVVRSVELKAAVVTADERESGERKLLNLGHTFAHAIEKCSSDYIHGEAVSIGLCKAAHISTKIGELPMVEYLRIETALRKLGLPLTASELNPDKLIQAAHSDKKRAGNSIEMILLHHIGESYIHKLDIDQLSILK